MTLTELLEHLAEEFLDDRAARIAGDDDQLWSDKLHVRRLNRAQDILCRRSWVIVDIGHPTAGVITLQEDQAIYKLHKSVLRVLAPVPTDQDAALAHFPDAALIDPKPFDDQWFNIDNTGVADPGRPIAYSTDIGTRLLRVFRTPSSDEAGLQLILRVARMPVTYLTLDDMEGSPEVPEEYHQALVDYAAGKALTQPNIDGAQRTIGKELLSDFKDIVKEARQERQRAGMVDDHWAFDTSTSVLR